jgi:hypothetical protein
LTHNKGINSIYRLLDDDDDDDDDDVAVVVVTIFIKAGQALDFCTEPSCPNLMP